MKPNKRELGTCYYPEHWPEDLWQTDAEQMINLGLKWVRIGEFSWSRLEPKENEFSFEWLDRAIEILGQAGLSNFRNSNCYATYLGYKEVPRYVSIRRGRATQGIWVAKTLLFLARRLQKPVF